MKSLDFSKDFFEKSAIWDYGWEGIFESTGRNQSNSSSTDNQHFINRQLTVQQQTANSSTTVQQQIANSSVNPNNNNKLYILILPFCNLSDGLFLHTKTALSLKIIDKRPTNSRQTTDKRPTNRWQGTDREVTGKWQGSDKEAADKRQSSGSR